MITNSSGEACTPSGPRSMPGASVMSRASSPEKPLVISVSLPDRMTITVRGSPVPCIAARNPSAIDSTAHEHDDHAADPDDGDDRGAEPLRDRLQGDLGDGDGLR